MLEIGAQTVYTEEDELTSRLFVKVVRSVSTLSDPNRG